MRITFKQFSELQQAMHECTLFSADSYRALTTFQCSSDAGTDKEFHQKNFLLHIPMLRRESGKKSKQINK